jgi:antitoxin (DNA-binding transcriptional repressor) of toxin-antitoxin stability system
MKFVNVRELRVRPGEVWKQLQKGEDMVLTSNGKPFALLIETNEDRFEEQLDQLRHSRVQLAVSRIREHARKNKLDKLSAKAIDELIKETRRRRRHA